MGVRDMPGEARLMEDGATADLRSKVSKAWQDFTDALVAALPTLPADTELALTLDPTASGTGTAVYEVDIMTAEDGELAASAVGNASLPEGYRLDRTAIGDLVALGWSPPGVVEGLGDRFGLRASTEQADEVASMVTRTLRDVYGAPHPAFLTYATATTEESAEKDGVPPKLRLGSARPARPTALAPASGGAGPLPERARTVVATLLGDEPEVDKEGDLAIRAGSAMVFVRVSEDPPLIDVCSPVLTEVAPSEKLYERLSQLTLKMPVGRLYYHDRTVWASVPVFGRDFQPAHLELAVRVMTGLADELDDRLHGEFGGKRFFDDNTPAGRVAAEELRTGMYL